MITLTRNRLMLSISEGMIPARGSQNVPVRYVNDTDEYANYLITPVVGWIERNGLPKSSIAEYSDGIIKLPARAFAQSCMASIAIKMTDSSDPTHVEVTYPQSFFIEKAPDGTLILPPTDEEWKQYIDDFVTQYFNQNIDPEMDEFQAEIIQRQNIYETQLSQNQADFEEQINTDFDNFIERVDGNPEALYRGYLISKNNIYSGVASNDGINLGKVVGKSEQDKTNGYQLFDASKIPTKSAGGATLTNNGDGSFTVAGSGNLSSTFDFTYTYSHETTVKLLKAGTLTLIGQATLPYCQVYFNKTDATAYKYLSLSNKNSVTAEITEEELSDSNFVMVIRFLGGSGAAIIPGTVKPMLYQDGDGTWEQFTGGIASPNIEYPQEIKNVEITNLISHRRQLLDASKLPTKSVGGATVTNNDDGSYTVSGSGSLTSNFYLNITLSADETKKLFKVGNLKGKINGNNVYPRPFINFYDKNGLLNSKIIDDTLNYEITQDMFDNGLYVLYGFTGTNGSQIVKGTVKPMLYQDGDGSWEQFQFNEVETNLELPSLPNGVADIYDNNAITRRIGVATFDGSDDELISEYNSGTGYFVLTPKGIKNIGATPSADAILSDKITRILHSSYKDEMTCYQTNTSIMLFTTQYTTKEAFKTWLNSNPLTFYYELATPTIEPFTVPTLPSYYPNTVAFHDSDVEPTEIEWHVETEKGYALPNENLLINPYFQAWQRGTSFTLPIASYNGYTADRVYSNASTFGAMKIEKARSDGGLKMTVLKEGYTYAPYGYYMKDSDLTRVRKKQVTLSYSVDGVIHVFTVDNLGFLVIQNDEIYEPSSYDGDDERCITNKGILTIQWNGLSVNDTKTLDWVKLELGDIATPYVPLSEEENLLDCLPYYQNLGNITCAYIDEVSGKHTFYYLVQGRFHVPMIGVPSITYSKVGDASSGSDLGVSANFSGRVTNEKIRSCQLSSSITNNLITLFDVIAEAEIK